MGSERMHPSVLWENCRAILYYLSKVMEIRGWPLMTGKGQILHLSAKMEKDRSRKPQSSQPYFSAWENYGTDPYRSYFQVHEGQDGDWKSLFGFTKDKSCLTNLNTFSDEATCSVDDRRAVDVIYLYFSKAFDVSLLQHPCWQAAKIWTRQLDHWVMENWLNWLKVLSYCKEGWLMAEIWRGGWSQVEFLQSQY